MCSKMLCTSHSRLLLASRRLSRRRTNSIPGTSHTVHSQASRSLPLKNPTSSNDPISKESVKYTLYNNWTSSCSARLRIALNLLKIPYTYVPVNTKAGEHHLPHHKALNPNLSIPTLVAEMVSGDDHVIGQSWAALEWLCETQRSTVSLMPKDPAARARVRELCMTLVADTQPLTSTRVKNRIESLGGDVSEWRRFWLRRGLDVYNGVMKSGPKGVKAGMYSVGDEVTLADCVLVPAVWKCEMEGLAPITWRDDLLELNAVYDRMMGLEEVKRAHYASQIDTPQEQRGAV